MTCLYLVHYLWSTKWAYREAYLRIVTCHCSSDIQRCSNYNELFPVTTSVTSNLFQWIDALGFAHTCMHKVINHSWTVAFISMHCTHYSTHPHVITYLSNHPFIHHNITNVCIAVVHKIYNIILWRNSYKKVQGNIKFTCCKMSLIHRPMWLQQKSLVSCVLNTKCFTCK